MNRSRRQGPIRYRIWITRQGENEGAARSADPPPAVALEPAEGGTMLAGRAARYVAAFNRAAAEHGRTVRAVALPVAVRYDGDPSPGQRLKAVEGC